MKRCDLLVDVGRRRFLSGAGVAAAGAAASTVLPASPAGAQTPAARVAYPTICPHKGFPLHYNAKNRTLNCSRPLLESSTARPAARRPGGTPPRTFRNTRSGSTRRATSTPRASTS